MRGFLSRGLTSLGRALVSYGYGAKPGNTPPPVIVLAPGVIVEVELVQPTVLEMSLVGPVVLEVGLVPPTSVEVVMLGRLP